MNKKYEALGVSSKKEDVRRAVNSLPSGLFPGAFCQAIVNPFLSSESGEPSLFLSHADGTGTKSVLAYLYWRETGDRSVFKNLVQDALIMNTDDLLCVGATDHFYFSSTIARNRRYIPGEVIQALIEGQKECIDQLQAMGVRCAMMGGETADMGDAVRTLTVDMNAATCLPRSNFIDTSRIKPDQVIIGLASFGQTSYENDYNSGIGSNGLTLARHEILENSYAVNYPETYDEQSKTIVYRGDHRLSDLFFETSNQSITYGKALLSPTRTYLPVIKKVLSEKIPVCAMIHLTGGGQAKSLHFGKNIHFIKDNLFALPPVFELLADRLSREELFSVFNCGHRLEIYLEETYQKEVIDISRSLGVEAQMIGYTESSNKNKLTLTYADEPFVFTN